MHGGGGAGVISEYMTSALEGLEWGWGAENVPIYKAIMAGIFSLGENRIYDLCRLLFSRDALQCPEYRDIGRFQ